MIMQLMCEDCHQETPLMGFVVKEDLYHTTLAHLLDTEIKTDEDFDLWLEKKKNDKAASYSKVGTLEVDGVTILDEFQRWERNGCVCPNCGSKHCEWY